MGRILGTSPTVRGLGGRGELIDDTVVVNRHGGGLSSRINLVHASPDRGSRRAIAVVLVGRRATARLFNRAGQARWPKAMVVNCPLSTQRRPPVVTRGSAAKEPAPSSGTDRTIAFQGRATPTRIVATAAATRRPAVDTHRGVFGSAVVIPSSVVLFGRATPAGTTALAKAPAREEVATGASFVLQTNDFRAGSRS